MQTIRTTNWHFRIHGQFTEVLACLCQPVTASRVLRVVLAHRPAALTLFLLLSFVL